MCNINSKKTYLSDIKKIRFSIYLNSLNQIVCFVTYYFRTIIINNLNRVLSMCMILQVAYIESMFYIIKYHAL